MLDASAPEPASVVVVQAVADGAPLVMLGFIATADKATLEKIQRAAAKRGIETRLGKGPENRDEVMIGFPQNGSRSAEVAFYHAALAGQFGTCKIEVMVEPIAALRTGKGLAAATAEEPAFIVDPKE